MSILEQIIPITEYPGRKGQPGVPQQILMEVPRCETFIECMVGSAVLSTYVTGCRVILNDIDPLVIARIDFAGDKRVGDYRYLIDEFDYKGSKAVLYFDPPYRMENRSHKVRLYKFEWTESQHIEFLKLVLQIKFIPVIISHYGCDLYDNALSKWRSKTFNSMTRGGVRVEKLWMNFPYPTLLQCPQYVGKNCTDRQRIQRKVARTKARFMNESEEDRAAILTMVLDSFNYLGQRSTSEVVQF